MTCTLRTDIYKRILRPGAQDYSVCVYACVSTCVNGFYGAYNCYGVLCQILGFMTVIVSAQDTHRILECWIYGRRKPLSYET